jgi:catechol 2,3-dioxygenase-like lactoylglutathione lyase family enzyme
MSDEWFARPVLFVADIDRSVDFYVKQLGFSFCSTTIGEPLVGAHSEAK